MRLLNKPSEELHAEIVKSIRIKRNLGTRAAAGYLRNRGYDIEHALNILLSTTLRPGV